MGVQQLPQVQVALADGGGVAVDSRYILIATPARSIRATAPFGISLVYAENSVKGFEMNTSPKAVRLDEDISVASPLAGQLDLPQRIAARSGQTSEPSPSDANGKVAQTQQSRLMPSPKALEKA